MAEIIKKGDILSKGKVIGEIFVDDYRTLHAKSFADSMVIDNKGITRFRADAKGKERPDGPINLLPEEVRAIYATFGYRQKRSKEYWLIKHHSYGMWSGGDPRRYLSKGRKKISFDANKALHESKKDEGSFKDARMFFSEIAEIKEAKYDYINGYLTGETISFASGLIVEIEKGEINFVKKGQSLVLPSQFFTAFISLLETWEARRKTYALRDIKREAECLEQQVNNVRKI
ncbi:MAG: hypothetical protein ABIF10_03895 [Candidatus Woesearchaeota archaeon]